MWTIHLTYHASFFMHTVIFLLGLQLPTLGSSAILSLLGFHILCKTPLTDCARITFHGLPSSFGSDSPHQAMVSYPTWKLPALCLGCEPPYLAPLLSLLWHPPLCHCCLQPSSQCRWLLGALSSSGFRTEFFWKGRGNWWKSHFHLLARIIL